MRVGVVLPSFGPEQAGDVAAHARHAEECGLESVWKGDHLIGAAPILDSTLVLTAAATATQRLRVGFGVLIPALRGAVWAAKQVATLQLLSGDRVLLGVGAGGSVHGEPAWRVVGVPFAERGRYTDAALEVLPGLIEGRTTVVGAEPVTLAPKATVPPVLVGGSGPVALRRAAWYADEWYPAFVPPAALEADLRRLTELADSFGRPAPGLSVSVSTGIGKLAGSAVESRVRGLAGYGFDEQWARAALALGDPAEVAERYAAYGDLGAGRIVAMPFGGDWFRQVELLGEVARQLS
ncbi:LLM class flavin-dependent oxidoreductase [Prauserella muralis]|uniref:Dehydrogenase n=1 Tax=Prauserella muralis TaxID=588067 RepID=A0A2V4AL85_9PSEU|nr:LLM class flavin-dependent oxidoreductase [Prauserella muralis]PXY21037.1 dehydrogenase [Prauserella muralis]TWE30111.1 alkanesulfonate monooxygenase SsuD/methylene tetrahydromethanopterin reductase-like flavin-dependent oxidoreductase (luciferase family) [Prauserella muralis]